MEEESRKVSMLLEKARSVPPGRYDVVFAPEMTGIFVHESIGHPFELDRIYGREGGGGRRVLPKAGEPQS